MKKQTCNICRKDKALSAFNMRQDGSARAKSCLVCATRQRESQRKNYAAKASNLVPVTKSQLMTDDIDVSKPLELDFLLDLNGWTAEEIKILLLTVKKYSESPYRMKPKMIFSKYFPGRTPPQCHKVLLEFMEVAAAGLKFEDYMRTDRRFRKDGKKVLAKSPK